MTETSSGQSGSGFPGGQGLGTLPLWRHGVWILAAILLVALWDTFQPDPVQQVSYTELRESVQQGEVASVQIKGQHVSGSYQWAPEASASGEISGQSTPTGSESRESRDDRPAYFRTTLPPQAGEEFLRLLETNNVQIEATEDKPAWWLEALIAMLPWILLIALFWWGARTMRERMAAGGGGGLLGFTQSKAKRYREESPGVGFADIAGADHAKQDLQEMVAYLSEPERFRRMGAEIPRGVLMMGPPGTGKTLMAKAVAGEAGVPFYSISGSEFIEMFVGVGASRVRDLFASAKKEAPAIIFIDEIDSVGRARGAGLGGGHDEREQTLNQILNEMDGFAPHEAVVVMAATNRPDVLDSALMRPGRFDRKVTLELPTREAREAILRIHTAEVPLAEDVDLATVARRIAGFSGADIHNLVNESALLATRRGQARVDAEAFEAARDKIVLGAERKGLLNDEEKRVVAYHESGHALMAWLLEHADPLEKVTIIPRGRALGVTQQEPAEERYNLTLSYLQDRIGVMLGGRIAEEVVFGEITTGAENDLKQATRLARKIISEWGMDPDLGLAAYSEGGESVFLGHDIGQRPEYSDLTGKLIDDKIRQLLEEMAERNRQRLREHHDRLQRLAETLLDEETLERERIEELLAD
jgi:cell division protease FtsH